MARYARSIDPNDYHLNNNNARWIVDRLFFRLVHTNYSYTTKYSWYSFYDNHHDIIWC